MRTDDSPRPGRHQITHPLGSLLGMADPSVSVIIHERVAHWSRQLRPRFQDWPIRWSETRSAASLVRAALSAGCPILVLGLDRQPARGLRDLDEALQVAPDALSLVIDLIDRGESAAEIASISREMGATIVLSGVVVPPEVEKIIRRWLPIAQARSEAQGWSASIEPQPKAELEPWEDPEWTRWPGASVPATSQPDRPDKTNPIDLTKDSV